MIKAGIVGASGYTGAELLRILWSHPQIEVTVATAHKYSGQKIAAVYPSLGKYYRGDFTLYEPGEIDSECDVVFLGLPHGESMKLLPELLAMGKKVVDLSADFRFEDPGLYRDWYGVEHSCPELVRKAAYGLTEIYRTRIAKASLVANPGCYPTAVLLGLFPLAKAGIKVGKVVVDAKSGVSGAGRQTTIQTHFPQIADSIEPYAVNGHRHQPEMKARIEEMFHMSSVSLVFIPHLVPMNRGILCTMYVEFTESLDDIDVISVYRDAYRDETFIQLLKSGVYPRTKAVQGSNLCHMGVEVGMDGGTVIVMVAIDNLVKGASGQAVQNMNLVCDLPEETGLTGPGIFP